MSNVLIVRTTILYNFLSSKRNFVKDVFLKMQRGIVVQATKNLFGNPTYIPHLSLGILSAIDKNCRGFLHIVGKDYCSRYDLALKIADTFGFDRSLVSDGPAWGEAKRGQYYGLNTDKAQSLGIPLFTLEEGLKGFKFEVDNVG